MGSNILKHLTFLVLFALFGCSTSIGFTKKELKTLAEQIETHEVLSKHFTGFMLLDPDTKEVLHQQNANKYFTPASNTKLFTLYTALEILGDDLPLLHYEKRHDSLIIWGTGNPLFLHPYFQQDAPIFQFLQQHKGPIFYSFHHAPQHAYGPGWAWDDYYYTFQTEMAAFPIYGNFVSFQKDTTSLSIQASPTFFSSQLKKDTTLHNRYALIVRDEKKNWFRFNEYADTTASLNQRRPFIYSPDLWAKLLEDTLHRSITPYPDFIPDQEATLSMPLPDTLMKRFMQISDNFLAEQLLLLCSDKLFGHHDLNRIIQYAKDSLLADSPDLLVWRDGSGLSRYNLFTPRSVVYLLQKIYTEYPFSTIQSIFPAGGKTGTIRKWYSGSPPFIYAKTGTMSNKHCLSGYLITDAGKTLIFSFMHNHYTGSPNPSKKAMEQVLNWIRINY